MIKKGFPKPVFASEHAYDMGERSNRLCLVCKKKLHLFALTATLLALCAVTALPASAKQSYSLPFLMGGKDTAGKDTPKYHLPILSGYYKNLFTVSQTLANKRVSVSLLKRFRFKVEQKFTDELSATITYDNEMLFTNFSDTSDFDLIREKDQRRLALWDLDEVFFDEKHFYWKHAVYRAYLKYYTPKYQVIVGKQGIDWSRMRFYQPFDLFNPISPLDIEADEKVGVDAINLELYPQDFIMINLIYAPYRNREKQGLGFRFSTKIRDYDLFVIASEIKKDQTLGFGFDGYIKEAGFRGECTYTFQDDEDEFFRSCVGLDYSFNRRLYGIVEYFYNGGASLMDIPSFLGSYEFGRKAKSVTKHLLGGGLEYEVNGVAKIKGYAFYDFEGESMYINPLFEWNIKPNFDLTFGAQIFEGDDSSEYGSYYNLYYVECKYFF